MSELGPGDPREPFVKYGHVMSRLAAGVLGVFFLLDGAYNIGHGNVLLGAPEMAVGIASSFYGLRGDLLVGSRRGRRN